MIARRTSSRRIGASLAAAALAVQLALSSWGMLALAFVSDPAEGFGEHALCLAGGDSAARPAKQAGQAPADQAPAGPTHDHGAYCCAWHPLPAVPPTAAATPLPVAYAGTAPAPRGEAATIPSPSHKPANARAPPTLA